MTPTANEYRFVFAHGWAMQNDFFDPLIRRLDIAQPQFRSRDYFRNDASDEATSGAKNDDRPWIGVGHSFGFQRLVDSDLSGCVGLVSLSGFLDFCQEPDGTDRRIVRKMIRKLESSPEDVVNDFRRRCGQAVFEPVNEFNVDPLREDLEKLEIPAGNSGAVDRIPTLALAAADDPIVPVELSRSHFRFVHVCPGGSHLLGYVFPYWCSLHILNFVQEIQSAKSQPDGDSQPDSGSSTGPAERGQ